MVVELHVAISVEWRRSERSRLAIQQQIRQETDVFLYDANEFFQKGCRNSTDFDGSFGMWPPSDVG
jgi:hypothetical protein